MKDEPKKRCDCIIVFQFKGQSQIFIFIIEVKDKYYSLTEIQQKLQTCIEKWLDEIGIERGKMVIIPILYAERHISNAKRTFNMYPVNILGAPKAIRYLKHGDQITDAIASELRFY